MECLTSTLQLLYICLVAELYIYIYIYIYIYNIYIYILFTHLVINNIRVTGVLNKGAQMHYHWGQAAAKKETWPL